MGMRGAVEIRCICLEIDDTEATDPSKQADHARAVAAFPLIAAKIKQDPTTLQIVFGQIAEDPFTEFRARVWT
jgi:hypothetical protein